MYMYMHEIILFTRVPKENKVYLAPMALLDQSDSLELKE